MSETTTPLAPESALEEAAPVEETVETLPEWSKPVQKVQQDVANFAKRFDRLESLISAAQATKNPEARQNKLESIMARLKGDVGQQLSPEIAELMSDLAGEIREGREGSAKQLSELENRQNAQTAFDEFMEDKPEGFRRAFIDEQKRIRSKYLASGVEVSDLDTQVHMTEWSEQWIKNKSTAGNGARKAGATGGSRAIPGPAGGKSVPSARAGGNPFGAKV